MSKLVRNGCGEVREKHQTSKLVQYGDMEIHKKPCRKQKGPGATETKLILNNETTDNYIIIDECVL